MSELDTITYNITDQAGNELVVADIEDVQKLLTQLRKSTLVLINAAYGDQKINKHAWKLLNEAITELYT